ncbi:MAG: hypothetical protein ACPG62_10885 [Cycloclasticus sp.]
MAFGENWATFDNVYGGEAVAAVDDNKSWYDGALDAVSDFGGAVYDGASNWLNQLMDFELKKEQLSYQNQLANQQAILSTVEEDQQTGQVPLSPNYRKINTGFLGQDSANKKILLLAAAGLAAYLYLK